MIGDAFVIDSVTHGFNFDPANSKHGVNFDPMGNSSAPGFDLYAGIHVALSAKDPRYVMTREQAERECDPALLASCLFEESQSDMACYHHVNCFAMCKKPISPMEIGKAAAAIAPGRFFFYGGISNVFDAARAIDDIDRHIEENGIIGLKFYPLEWDDIDARTKVFQFNDDKGVAFSILEHAQKRGIRVIAMHKAQGNLVKAYSLADIDEAVMAFPDLSFEIVHGGWAFLDETVTLASLPNVYVNLEGTSAFLHFAPRRFADILGRLLMFGAGAPGAEDRILWSTGAMAMHPQPFLEKFWAFQIPEDMVEGYGYPQLTEEIKRKILAENFARMHGLDLKTLAAGIPNDEMRRRQLSGELAEPWSKASVLAA